MKASAFAYHAPASRDALLGLLADLEDCRLLAGGQSLVPLLNLRLAAPAHLIDLNGVPGLDGIACEGADLVVGAMTRQRTAERSPLVADAFPVLTAALRHVGSQQIRNRGTIGGSLAHMDAVAEIPVVAAVSDATLDVESMRGVRRIPFAAWSDGFLATTIARDEVLTRIRFPCWPAGHGWGFEEATRRGESFATVSSAALVLLDAHSRVVRSALAVGGLAAAPIRLPEAEAAFLGSDGSEAAIADAIAAIGDLPAEDDIYASAGFKRHLARTLAARALRQAATRAGAEARS